jgi:cold shock protein
MARGTVKWFNSQKGYGFIQPQDGGNDVFVHISSVERAGLPGLNEGQSIGYEVISNRGGSQEIFEARLRRYNGETMRAQCLARRADGRARRHKFDGF